MAICLQIIPNQAFWRFGVLGSDYERIEHFDFVFIEKLTRAAHFGRIFAAHYAFCEFFFDVLAENLHQKGNFSEVLR